MPRRPLTRVLAVSGIAVTAAVSAAVTALASGGGDERRRAVVVGDSLSFEAAPDIEAAAADGIDVEVDAVPGSSVAQRVDAVAAAAGQGPDVLVIALGTNDVYYAIPGQRSAVRRALAAARPARCVVWVLVGAVPGRSPASFNRFVATAASAGAEPPVRVVRWDRVSAGRTAWIAADGIHHTASGRRAFADAIADGIRSCGDGR